VIQWDEVEKISYWRSQKMKKVTTVLLAAILSMVALSTAFAGSKRCAQPSTCPVDMYGAHDTQYFAYTERLRVVERMDRQEKEESRLLEIKKTEAAKTFKNYSEAIPGVRD
jgi:hypothetical protein